MIGGWLLVHTAIVVYIGQSGRDFLINDAGSTLERYADFERWSKAEHSKPIALIVGSSTAYRNIDPYILDSLTRYTWFNLASSSQTVEVSAALAKIAYARLHRIDVLLIDIYPEISDIKNYESVYDWVNNSTFSFTDKYALMRTATLDLRLVNAGYYRWLQHALGWKVQLQPTTNKGNYVGKGYAYSLKKPNNDWSPIRKGKKIKLAENVQSLIRWAKDHNIKVIVNIAPDLSFTYEAKALDKSSLIFTHNTFLSGAKNAFQLFYDSHHMTRQGGIMYTNQLARKINQIDR
jgi:hypothetical protein